MYIYEKSRNIQMSSSCYIAFIHSCSFQYFIYFDKVCSDSSVKLRYCTRKLSSADKRANFDILTLMHNWQWSIQH